MPKRRDTKQFGETLRRLRSRRGLSLGQVAAASGEVATDSAGRISQPYLSQLEAGRAESVALPKLLTLAALYRTDVGDLLAVAPEERRQTLMDDLARWKADCRPIPEPVRYLPGQVNEVNRGVADALTTKSKNVRLPLDDQERAWRETRRVMIPSALPAFLLNSGASLIRRFWQDLRTEIDGRSYQRTNPWWWWDSVVSDFQEWLLYEVRAADDVLSGVASWTLDFDSFLASCHFHDPKAEKHFGYFNVPAAAVTGVRRIQIAYVLSSAKPAAQASAVGLPDPIDGIKLHLSTLIGQLSVASSLSYCRALAQRIGIAAATSYASVDSITALLQQFSRSPAITTGGAARTLGRARAKRTRRKR